MIKLELPIDAVNMILGALGELPSKTNAMALMLLIKEQADPQVPKEEPKPEPEPETVQ
jgi:hypothetical protein